MNNRDLADRARRAGLSMRWRDAAGQIHRVSNDSIRRLLAVMENHGGTDRSPASLPAMVVAVAGQATVLPNMGADAPATFGLVMEDGSRLEGPLRQLRGRLVLPALTRCGYHRLEIGSAHTTLALSPPACPSVASRMAGGPVRPWGMGVQIHGLHTPGDGGIGHFGALGSLARTAAGRGADVLAISPVHAMFAARPGQYSPYSPSSRLFLNPLLGDPHAVFDTATIQGAEARQGREWMAALRALEHAPLIEWEQATAHRYRLLRQLYEDRIAPSPPDDLQAFRHAGGRALEQHAIFETLHAHFTTRGARGGDWRCWPQAMRQPDSPEVARFAAAFAHDVGFHVFMQWLAARSLAQAGTAARNAGMRIGLIADMAVGVDPTGSECWARQDQFLVGAAIGAPPDMLSPLGQDWGLTTFSPRGLKASGYRAFIDTLRAGFAHGGGLRIDHVMALERLWVIPQGGTSAEGAYLSFPVRDLMRLVALEATRANAVVIGEDLGTVTTTFRKAAEKRGIMGMNVLFFERTAQGAYKPPAAWSRNAVAMTTTHDLATVAGWWQGIDLEWRIRLGQMAPGVDVASLRAGREHDRAMLWAALVAAGARPARSLRARRLAETPPPTPAGAAVVVDEAVSLVARTPCPLAVIALEDLLGLAEQPNLPGTTTGHPNWRRRYPGTVATVMSGADVRRRINRLRAGRGGNGHG